MKTWILLLSGIFIFPTAATFTLSQNRLTQQAKINHMLSNGNNLKLNDNSGYDWNGVQNLINTKLDNPVLKNQLSPEQLKDLKLKTIEKTNQFDNNNITAKQSIGYFLSKNPQFQSIYNNNQNGFKTIQDKINAQYFNLQKIDLNLDGANTYADLINNLNIAINSTYLGNNIVVSLGDEALANQYLFNDSTSESLSNFINNNISIKVNVQFNGQLESKTINLTNLKIDPVQDDAWLYECIKYYFNADNKQDLDLTATNTKSDALTNVIKKISARFNINIGQDLSNHSGIQVAIANINDAEDNFLKKGNVLSVMNQNMNFDVNIYDYNSSVVKTSTAPLSLKNINFNSDNMKQVIKELWLNNNSQNSPIDLQMTSDQTYQQAMDNFNQRIQNLNQKDHFEIQLTDQSIKDRKLDADYNPVNKIFKAIVQFSYLENNERKIINNNHTNKTDLYLSNVILSQWAQNTKDKFDSAVSDIDTLAAIGSNLGYVSMASGALAFVCWLTCNPYAAPLTIFSAATGTASAIISLRVSQLRYVIQQLAFQPTILISNVFSIISGYFTFIYRTMIGLEATIQADWQAAALFFTVSSITMAAIKFLDNWIKGLGEGAATWKVS